MSRLNPAIRFRKRRIREEMDGTFREECEIRIGRGKEEILFIWEEADPREAALAIGEFGVETIRSTYEIYGLAWNLMRLIHSQMFREFTLALITQELNQEFPANKRPPRIIPFRNHSETDLILTIESVR